MATTNVPATGGPSESGMYWKGPTPTYQQNTPSIREREQAARDAASAADSARFDAWLDASRSSGGGGSSGGGRSSSGSGGGRSTGRTVGKMTDSAGGSSIGSSKSDGKLDTQKLYDTMLKRQDEQIERDAEEAKLDREAEARRDAILAKSQYNKDLLNWATENKATERANTVAQKFNPEGYVAQEFIDKPVDPTSGSGLGFNSDAFGSSGSGASSALNQPYNSTSGIPSGGINNQNQGFPAQPSWLSGPTPRERYAAQDRGKFLNNVMRFG